MRGSLLRVQRAQGNDGFEPNEMVPRPLLPGRTDTSPREVRGMVVSSVFVRAPRTSTRRSVRSRPAGPEQALVRLEREPGW